MRIERLRELPPAPAGSGPVAGDGSGRPAVVAVGNFDGLHRGHQMALRLAREEALRRDAEFIAVTFDPHPARVLRPDRAPQPITSFSLKAERLSRAGVERLVVLEFGEAIARTPPADFALQLLVGRLRAAAVVQGANFRFGRGRTGDVATLRALGARHGFRVIEAPSVSWGGEIVSSTRIREALAAGNLELAAALLGGFYEIEGVPVGGKGRGRDLGFPTANLDPGDELLLPYGVYAADVSLPSLKKPEAPFFRAVVHYGPRPTFREDAPSLEVHIVGFSGAVSRVRLRFLRFLRGVRAFAGRESLRRQLERDVAEARGLTAFPAAESLSQPAEAVLAG